jgi:hypothetical protein
MDRRLVDHQLATAERQIAISQRHVAIQQESIEVLRRGGSDAAEATSLLEEFENLLASPVARRDHLLNELRS